MKAVWFGYTVGAVFCAVFASVATILIWPPMSGDAAVYFPAAVEWARGNAFENTVWLPPLNDTVDGPGGRRYVLHGFLFPLLSGWIGWLAGGDVQGCIAGVFLITWMAAALCGAGVLACWRFRDEVFAPGRFLIGMLAFTGCFALAFAWPGRMEAMVMLWLGIAILGWRYLPDPLALVICGACVSLMAFTSPMVGGMALGVLGVALLMRPGPLNLRIAAAVCFGGFGALFLCWAIYPFPIADWVGGTIRHSRIHFGQPSFQGFFATWVAKPHSPLLIVSLVILVSSSLVSVVSLGTAAAIWRRLLAAGGVAIFLLLIFRLTLMKSEAAYNAVVWFPLMAAVSLYGSRTRLMALLVGGAFALSALGLARSTVILADHAMRGQSYADTRKLVDALAPEGIAVAKNLFLIPGDFRAVVFGDPVFLGAKAPRWFIEGQAARGAGGPREYKGFELVRQTYGQPVQLFGLPVSRTPTGWQYALYRRTDR